METLIGFAVGYVVGTQQGRDGLVKLRESFDAIRTSPEVRELLTTGLTIASGTAKQVMAGGVIEEITRRVFTRSEDRPAA